MPAPPELSHANWDDLRVFLAVAQTGSLGLAAGALGLTQPTVGRRLDRLEAALGLSLVRRSSQGCQPTERGAALLPLVERMGEAADGVAQLAAARANELAGVVRVAVGDLMARHLARHLPSLLAGAPGLRVEVVSGLGFVSLERGEADLAMRTRVPAGEGWVVRPSPRSHFAVYGSPAYIAGHPAARDPVARWEQCAWVGYTSDQSTPSARYLAAHREAPPEVAFSSSLLVLEAAALGAGLALLPAFCGEDEPRLQRVGPVLDDLFLEGALVIHPSARRLPRVRWVAARLVELFGRR